MTVNEAQNVLFQHYLTEDIFKLSQISKVFLTFDEDIDKRVVRIALNDLVKTGILSQLDEEEGDTDEYWVLNKPLQNFEQTVILSALTASTISQIVNRHCEKHNDMANICNPIRVTDRDIQNLLKLILELPEEEDQF